MLQHVSLDIFGPCRYELLSLGKQYSMHTQSIQTLERQLLGFDEITLDGLKDTRRLFSRIDTKYITDLDTLQVILDRISDQYQVLEIGGKHVFEYDTVYLDTPDYFFFNQHIDGAPLRTKVRTRHYVDADLTYFEVKLKSKNLTNKYRVKIPKHQHGGVGDEGWNLYQQLYKESYGTTPTHELVPQTKTIYKRITLAHKTLPEKVTIDVDLVFDEAGHDPYQFKELVVIEVKSPTKNNYLGKVIEDHGYGVRDHCSKYCLSLCYLNIAQQKEYFVETMKMMNQIEKLEEEVLDTVYHQMVATRNG